MTHQSNNLTNITNSVNDMSTLVVIVEQYMSIYGSFVLTTLGIVGNILSILIFLSPRYRRQSSHFYLLSLATCDLCFLMINLVEDTFRNHNDIYHSRINILDRSSPLVCILVQYARNVTRLLSSWIVVSFTIERLLVVFYPLRRAIICRRKIARFVLLILFVTSLLININVPFHYGIINLPSDFGQNETICDILIQYRSSYMKFAISTMITVYLLPMCIIGIVNSLICCKLWRKSLLTEKEPKPSEQRQKPRKTLLCSLDFSEMLSCFRSSSSNRDNRIKQPTTSRTFLFQKYQSTTPRITIEENTTQIHSCLLTDETPTHSGSHSFSNSSITSPTNTKQSSSCVKTYIQSRTHRVTVTLLLVSCSFLLLNSPYCAVWIANYIQGFRNNTLKSIKEITELFMLTNFSINFLLYCVSGKVFRGELMYLLRCNWKELYNRNEAERSANQRLSRPQINIQLQESKAQRSSKNPMYD